MCFVKIGEFAASASVVGVVDLPRAEWVWLRGRGRVPVLRSGVEWDRQGGGGWSSYYLSEMVESALLAMHFFSQNVSSRFLC